jgi:drug/metabolite transporter (DMT)-like permease
MTTTTDAQAASDPDDAYGADAQVPPRSGGVLPVLAIVVTVLLWASAFVAIRHLGDHVSPGPLTLGRLAVASAVLGGLLLVRRHAWPARRHWPRLLLCGVAWFAVYNVALNAAEQRLDAGTAAMLVNIGPLLIALLAGLVLGEGFPRPLVIGSGVAFAGVLVIGAASSTGDADLWGVVLCVVAAITYAIGVVAQKPLLRTLPALQVTWIACTIGAVCTLPSAPDLVHDLTAAPPSALAWVVYLGVMPTAVAFTTWAYALARSSAGRLGASTYLVPPLTVLGGWVLLGEVPTALAGVGGVVCLVGVAVSRRRPRETR